MATSCSDAEKQLGKYEDEFCESMFVPFPSVERVIEAITETGVHVIPTISRVDFYKAIIENVQAEIDKELTWYG